MRFANIDKLKDFIITNQNLTRIQVDVTLEELSKVDQVEMNEYVRREDLILALEKMNRCKWMPPTVYCKIMEYLINTMKNMETIIKDSNECKKKE